MGVVMEVTSLDPLPKKIKLVSNPIDECTPLVYTAGNGTSDGYSL